MPVNSQQTLNNQLIGAQGAQQMYLPQAAFAYQAYPPSNAIIYNQPMQYQTMAGYSRPYSQPVYYAPNISYNPAPRGSAPPVTTVPVPTMSGAALSQQNMMASQVTAPVQQPALIQKKKSHAVTIRHPDTKEVVKIGTDSSVDASETVSSCYIRVKIASELRILVHYLRKLSFMLIRSLIYRNRGEA